MGNYRQRVRMTETTPNPTTTTEATEFQTGRLVTIAGGHAVHDTYTAFLAPLLPRFVDKLSLSNTSAGLLSVFLQIPSLFQSVIGHLADKTALRWIVILGPGATATAMSFLGWAPGYLGLALLLMLAGVSVAAFHATAPVAVSYLSGNRLGRGMGFFMVGGELGRTLGPLVVVSTLAITSLRSMAFLSLAGIATSLVLYFLLRDAPLRSKEDGEQVPWRDAVRSMRGLMVMLGGLTAVRSMMMMSVTIFLPLFLTQEGTSIWLAGAALSIVEAAGIAGAFAGGWVSDHVGRRAVLIFGHVTAPIALLLFLATDGSARIALLPVIGITLLAVPPVLMALVQEQVPESRALANGVYLSMNFAIRSTATIAFGAVGDIFGLETAMLIGAIAMFAGLPLIWVLFGRDGVADKSA
jgi:FSR family fosmidomycin resistance protein-like MFS transporter